MITVKLYGLLRLDSGIREMRLEAHSVKEVYAHLMQHDLRQQDLDGCVILINGSHGSKRSKLNDGDEVILLSPIAGG